MKKIKRIVYGTVFAISAVTFVVAVFTVVSTAVRWGYCGCAISFIFLDGIDRTSWPR